MNKFITCCCKKPIPYCFLSQQYVCHQQVESQQWESICRLSIWVMTTYYMFPAEVGFHYTFGNDTTCSISGFLAIFGAAGTNIYNAGLSFNFLYACVFGWSDERIRKRIEIPTHIFWLLYLIVPSIAISQDYLNTTTSTRACMFGSEPYNCNDDPNIECVRGGDEDALYRSLVHTQFGLIVACTSFGVINTIVVAFVATRQLKRGNNGLGSSLQIQNRIQKIRTRAVLYGLSRN